MRPRRFDQRMGMGPKEILVSSAPNCVDSVITLNTKVMKLGFMTRVIFSSNDIVPRVR